MTENDIPERQPRSNLIVVDFEAKRAARHAALAQKRPAPVPEASFNAAPPMERPAPPQPWTLRNLSDQGLASPELDRLDHELLVDLNTWAIDYLEMDRARKVSPGTPEARLTILDTEPTKACQPLLNQALDFEMYIPAKTGLGKARWKQVEFALQQVAKKSGQPLDREEIERFRSFYTKVRELRAEVAPKPKVVEIYFDDFRRDYIREQLRALRRAELVRPSYDHEVATRNASRKVLSFPLGKETPHPSLG